MASQEHSDSERGPLRSAAAGSLPWLGFAHDSAGRRRIRRSNPLLQTVQNPVELVLQIHQAKALPRGHLIQMSGVRETKP